MPDEHTGGCVVSVELAEHVADVDERLVQRRVEDDCRGAVALGAGVDGPVQLERGAG